MGRIILSAVAVVVASLGGAMAGAAPIAVTATGTAYTEDFNIGTTPAEYVDISTIAGLSAYISGGGTAAGFTTASSLTQIRRNTAYGTTQAVSITNQQLGSINYNATTASGGYNAFGMSYVNNTGQTLTSFDLSFITFADTTINPTLSDAMTFSYGFDAATLKESSTAWTYVSELGFSAVPSKNVTSNPTPEAVIDGLSWAPGSVLTLRWKDVNAPDPAGDRAMAIDNVSVTFAVPEPGTMGVLGVGALGLIRRRR
jgi:hypothetical protein